MNLDIILCKNIQKDKKKKNIYYIKRTIKLNCHIFNRRKKSEDKPQIIFSAFNITF